MNKKFTLRMLSVVRTTVGIKICKQITSMRLPVMSTDHMCG